MQNETSFRMEIVEAGKRLYQKGLVASNDGNISVRLNENEIMITPTGVCKGDMSPDQMLKVDMDGKLISGFMKPTSEMKMHLAVYRLRKDVKAIVHAHPPKATAFAVAGKTLDKITLPEVIFALGSVSMSEYGTPSTDELPKSIEKHIGTSDAILLANHGALTVGTTVMDAYFKMETLEHFASISLYARMLGGERCLNQEETDKLYKVRSDVFGKSNPDCTGCGACDGGPECRNSMVRNHITDQKQNGRIVGSSDEDQKRDADLGEQIKRIVLKEIAKLDK